MQRIEFNSSELVSILTDEEFRYHRAGRWMGDHVVFTFQAVLLYLATIFSLKQWMKEREPFKLQVPVAIWNFSIALVSGVRAAAMTREYFAATFNEGFYGIDSLVLVASLCSTRDTFYAGSNGLAVFVLLFARLPEFIDTLFIALSLNVYIPANFGIMFTIGCVSMSLLTMKLAAVMKDFSLKPVMVISVCLHLFIYAVIVCVIPEWSTVRPNDEPSLLVQPKMSPVLLLALMFGVADAANNSTRFQETEKKQFDHHLLSPSQGLAAGLLLFVVPSLSVYAYVAILTTFLAVSTIVFFHSYNFIRDEECNAAKMLTEIALRVTEKGEADNSAFTRD